MSYFNWNDSKIWDIFLFCGAEWGGPDPLPLAETLYLMLRDIPQVG